MTRSYVQPGEVLDHTPSAAVANGAVVVIGARIGVALKTIAAGETGPLQVTGVHALPKKSSDSFVQGAAVYWDGAAGNFTSTATSNTLGGYAAAPAGAGATVVNVKLNG